MNELAMFQRFWREVGNKVGHIVRDQGGRLLFSEDLQVEQLASGDRKISILEPIMFYSAPYKGGSKKPSARRAIFIDGTFQLRIGGDTLDLVQAACNLAVYDTEEVAKQSYILKLVDSMHFDMEDSQSQNEFHPMFHAQRGYSTMITRAKVVKRAMTATRLTEDQIEVIPGDQSLEFMRLPTPQMDMLSVLATVVADVFCHKKSSRPVKDAFHELLKKLLEYKNVARDGLSSRVLAQRWSDRPPFAAAHWYKEVSGLGMPVEPQRSAQASGIA